MHSWITFSQDTVHLDAGEGIEMHYTIDVPQDVPNGGQYAAIMAETEEASGSSSALKANSRVAMKVYARIAGETRESGNIIENNVPGIVFGGNLVTTTSLVENTGNVHQEAKYIMRVFPFGSGEEVYTNEEDPTKATILPETKRYYSLTWEQTPQLGLYTVEQVVEFAGQTSTTSKLVVICPIWLLIIFIALILAIIFTIVTRARSRKQERRESSASRSHHSSEKHEKSEDKE